MPRAEADIHRHALTLLQLGLGCGIRARHAARGHGVARFFLAADIQAEIHGLELGHGICLRLTGQIRHEVVFLAEADLQRDRAHTAALDHFACLGGLLIDIALFVFVVIVVGHAVQVDLQLGIVVGVDVLELHADELRHLDLRRIGLVIRAGAAEQHNAEHNEQHNGCRCGADDADDGAALFLLARGGTLGCAAASSG